jgi:O-antigen ligase
MVQCNEYGSRPGNALSFWLICGLFIVLWVAGGASRADVMGQVVTRASTWGILIAAILSGTGHSLGRMGFPGWLFAATAALVALQLVPLPPSLWLALPGREALAGSAALIDAAQPWRPLSISPGGTRNALGSLVVPLAALILAARLRAPQHWQLLSLVLGLILAASVLGIFEYSGAMYDNPLLNDRLDQVNGSFANRNHFALFTAIGVMIAPIWGLRGGGPAWKPFAAIGMVALLLLVVLATGSRSGVLLSIAALVFGFWTMRTEVASIRRKLPRPIFWTAVVATAALVLGAITISISMDRALSVDRATELEASSDVRIQTLPTVIGMVGKYFPAGSGYGTFDRAFRIDEPTSLLSPQYLNAAHNDVVQVVLEGGVAGLVLLIVAMGWWAKATLRAWKGDQKLGKIGSAIIGLTVLASITDYPARTPMIMALVAVASIWLARPAEPEHRGTPGRGKSLPMRERPL